MYAVEKNVPIPEGSGMGGGKYPWRLLEVGDSFKVDRKDMKREGARPWPPKSLGIKVSCRKEGDGMRVWRIA